MLKGCDISKYQKEPDFVKLNSAVDFVFIRSSYGDGYTDQQFARNRLEARKAGMFRGFYHYAYPNNNSPESEAEWFLKVIGEPDENDIFALDFEEIYDNPVNWSLRFLNRFSEKTLGYKPLIYINLALNNSFDWKPVVDAKYGLWLARWDYNSDGPAPTTDWSNVYFRQYSNNSNFAGIEVPTDGDVFYGDKEILKSIGYHKNTLPQPTESILTGDNTKVDLGDIGIMEIQRIKSIINDLRRDLENEKKDCKNVVNNAVLSVKQDDEKIYLERINNIKNTYLEENKKLKIDYETKLLKKFEGLSFLTKLKLLLK
jgi:lysozyme